MLFKFEIFNGEIFFCTRMYYLLQVTTYSSIKMKWALYTGIKRSHGKSFVHDWIH